MSDEPKRVDLRFGDVAISVRGFDDPVGPVKQVLRFVQRVVEETPELTKLSLTLDDDEIASLVEDVSQQLEMRDGELEITPALIVAAKTADVDVAEPAPAPMPPVEEPAAEPAAAVPAEEIAEEEPEPEAVEEYLEAMRGPDASERIFEDADPEPADISEDLEAEVETHRDFGAAIEPPYDEQQEPEPEPRVINIFGDPSDRRRASEPEPDKAPPLRHGPAAAEQRAEGDPLSFLRRRTDAAATPQEDIPAAETATNIFAEPEATPAEDTGAGLAAMDEQAHRQEEAPAPELTEPEPGPVNIFAENTEVTPQDPAPIDPVPLDGDFDRQSILRVTEPGADHDPGHNGAAPAPPKGSSRFEALVARYRRDPGHADGAGSAGGAMPAPPPIESPAAGVTATAAISAGDLARSAGATTVPELLGAAAAWLSVIKGQNRFARRDVMAVFDEIPGDHARSLEARIKGYGKLVRNGVLVLVDDGMFALSEDERERFKDLLS